MLKTTRVKMSESSEKKSTILMATPKGLIKISHFNNVMIVETQRKNLFLKEIPIRLTSDINVFLEGFSKKINKGTIGHLKFGRVYFNTSKGFLGLGKEYIADNTNYLIPNLC